MQAYTQYINFVGRGWKKFRKRNRLKNDFESFFRLFFLPLQAHAKTDETEHDLDAVINAGEAWIAWKYAEADHYFIEQGVAEFCMESIKTDKPKDIHDMMALFPRPHADGFVHANMDFSYRKKVGAFFHFPTNSGLESIAVVHSSEMTKDINKVDAMPWWLGYHIVSNDAFYTFSHEGEWNGFEDATPAGLRLMKLAVGLSCYINAFPECVRDSKIDMIQKVHGYKGRRKYIKSSDVVSREDRSARTPHFRRGHFRYLQSDRYTHAKGTVVFVNGCFVKGKAYDVHTLESADALR